MLMLFQIKAKKKPILIESFLLINENKYLKIMKSFYINQKNKKYKNNKIIT